MDDSYFALIDGDSRAARYAAGPATAGPWDERLQHGGPPTALAITIAEDAIRGQTGRTDLVALRFAADFIGPVPVGDVEVRAEVRRVARSAALVEVAMTAAGRVCLLTRVWFLRRSDTSGIAPGLGTPVSVPERAATTELDVAFAFGASMEWRFVANRMSAPGPAAAWVRAHTDLLPGRPTAGLSRVALIADSGSGISAELDWSFSDVCGRLGSGLQTLLVAPLPSRR